MRATPVEYPGSVELQELLGMLVLESGSFGLAEGGGVRDEMGLPFSSFTSGERGLQGCWLSCRAMRATAASLE